MANAIGSGGGVEKMAHDWPEGHRRNQCLEMPGNLGHHSRFNSIEMVPGETETGRPTMSKTVSKPKEMGGTSRKKEGVKKITESEFQFRMEMSLCFLCGEHYGEDHEHECKNKHLQLILVDDDDELFDEDETDEEEEQETVMGQIQNALSMNSTVGNDSDSATFKFRGKIGRKEVIVKIGSAATHNFISREVVAELQLPV